MDTNTLYPLLTRISKWDNKTLERRKKVIARILCPDEVIQAWKDRDIIIKRGVSVNCYNSKYWAAIMLNLRHDDYTQTINLLYLTEKDEVTVEGFNITIDAVPRTTAELAVMIDKLAESLYLKDNIIIREDPLYKSAKVAE